MNDHYYCKECGLAYREQDTDTYYSPGFPTNTGARGCPVEGNKLEWIDPDDIDPSIFDHEGTRP